MIRMNDVLVEDASKAIVEIYTVLAAVPCSPNLLNFSHNQLFFVSLATTRLRTLQYRKMKTKNE